MLILYAEYTFKLKKLREMKALCNNRKRSTILRQGDKHMTWDGESFDKEMETHERRQNENAENLSRWKIGKKIRHQRLR